MIEAFLTFDFIRYSVLSGLIVGIIAPLIGAFIVIRRLSLIADALSHVTLGGIAFGVWLSSIFTVTINPLVTGIVFSVIGALGIERLRTVYSNYKELAIPIIMSAGIAVGIVLLSMADGINNNLFAYLFGSISAVGKTDFYLIAIIAVIVCLFIFIIYKELFLLSFDEEYANVMKAPKWIQIAFIIVVALVISASMRIVGILLVSALMTLPVASAMRVTSSFKQLMFVSVIFGEIAVILGLVASYYLSISPGGTIVLVSLLILLATVLKKSNHKQRGELDDQSV